MSRTIRVTLPLLIALAACQRPISDASAAEPMPDGPVSSQAQPPEKLTCDAQSSLAKMDKRVPVPLVPMMANHQKQNMREHLEAIQQVVDGLTRSDFAAIEKASARIGYSEQMGMMCSQMGAGAAGFTEQALRFHHTADTIAAAAHRHDKAATLKALTATLQTCTASHAVYRQEVVDDATWTTLTGKQGMHGH